MMRILIPVTAFLALSALSHLALALDPLESLPPRNPLPAPLTDLQTTYAVDRPFHGGHALDLVAEGRTRARTWCVARARVPSLVRAPTPHRIARTPGDPRSWTACWHLVIPGPRRIIGCLRRRVGPNNHPDPTRLPETALALDFTFDTATQRFVLHRDPSRMLPLPIPLPRPWTARRVLLPLPLDHTTPAVAKRALRARGATPAADPAGADALVLPDSADFCLFDRRSHPRTAAALLARGLRVIPERALHE
jgi:hypothetical protein